MDIWLFDDNFLVTQPILSQHRQKPKIKNFSLMSIYFKNLDGLIFATIISKELIFLFLSLNLQNSKVKKWKFCPWKMQIQPLFEDKYGKKTNVENWFLPI